MYLPLSLVYQCKAVTGVQKASSKVSSKRDFGKHSDNFIIDHKLLTDYVTMAKEPMFPSELGFAVGESITIHTPF